MRFVLSAALLAAGIAIGAAVPAVSAVTRTILAAIGLPRPAVPPGPEPAGGPDHDPTAAAVADRPEAAPGGHGPGAGEAHADEGQIRMPPDQVTGQDITVMPVEGGILARHLLVPGTITPDTDRIARVPARVVGTVAEMRKRLGDAVQKDEVVAVLDSREVADAKSEYLTALVQAELQTINYERQQKLLASRSASEAAFQSARAAFLENRLRVDLARQKLSALGLNAAEVAAAQKRDEATPNLSTLRRYELRAPFAGRVVERRVDVGSAVGKEGDPADLYMVADLATVWIELAVPIVDLAQVREGARVAVTPSREGGDRRAVGRVIFVSPFLNPDTRSARVVVALPNADLAWRPGTFVTAEVEIARDSVPVRVPKTAVQTLAGRRVVFVRIPEGFERRAVELGRSDDVAYEVTAGLQAGEAIAVGNAFVLKAELGKAEAGHDD
ncbi:efflux RND transporter periplasmic adaptor subunit [Methylobacterium sp. NEAU K]|uniref:efflux RND transporter periplasmic adaptor subunit n=1 Tax=Methylobacterium sp. NEAU K TaxID=3064946 RepID=UPI0027332164|nr:efflux RND transporter periplasmic adaptor subunit [Methylobacterium sp. NEAU K]MDP4006911.1 efflux RND transporter periplasmic adaptor subunit [Methylobacterium sp. NEAU K]